VAADRSSECEFTLKDDRVGELLMRGPHIVRGYVDGKWGSVKKIVDDEGFYHTGDLIRVNADNSMSFIRRLGLVVKLQQGEFVDIEAIESVLERSPLIITCFVHAEANQPAVVGVCSIDSNVLKERVGEEVVIAFRRGAQDARSLVENHVCQEGEKLIRTAGMKGFNIPKAYHIVLDVDWTSDSNLFTPSMKKKHGPFSK